jgi:serine/threonine protein kinase
VLLARVEGDWVCKIADFGFTSIGESGQQYSSVQGRMTVAYCAPELLIHGLYSKKADIWAVGCILYEVCFASYDRRRAFGTAPTITSYYHNDTIPPPQIGWEILGLNHNDIPEKYEIYKVAMQRRWSRLNIVFAAVFRRDPEERPTALELKHSLDLIAIGEDPPLVDYRVQPELL